MRLGDLSATGEQINFDGVFDRNSMTPGDNHVTSLEVERIQVRSTNLNLESGRFRGRIAGELRGDDLLPRTWLVDGAFPSGSFTGRNLAGTFDGGSGRLRFAWGFPDRDSVLPWLLTFGDRAELLEPAELRETLRQVGEQCYAKAHYLADELCKLPGVKLRYPGPFFHEFVTDLPDPTDVLAGLEAKGILGGFPLKGGLLWCATEKQTREELDRTVAIVKEVLGIWN